MIKGITMVDIYQPLNAKKKLTFSTN